MRTNMKRIWALTLAVVLLISLAPGALAAEYYYSGTLNIGDRVTVEPERTQAPEVTPAPEQTEEPEQGEEAEPAVTPLPSIEPEPTADAEITAPRTGVIYKKSDDKVAIVREGPSSDTLRIGKAHHGDVLTVYGEENGWLQVEVNGLSGWVHGGLVSFDLSLIEEATKPEETTEPEETAEPEETTEPEETAEPEETTEPEETAEPEETTEPEEATEPEETEAPEETAEPEVAEEPTEGTDGEPDFEPIEDVPVNNDADVRSKADGLSEIIVTITAETPVTVLGVEGDWVKVLADGVTGYVYIDDIACIKELGGVESDRTEESAENQNPIKVTIFTSRRTVVEPGETIVLTSKLEGTDGYEIKLQWQCDKGDGFEDVPGANEDAYSFAASMETLTYSWRLVVYYR